MVRAAKRSVQALSSRRHTALVASAMECLSDEREMATHLAFAADLLTFGTPSEDDPVHLALEDFCNTEHFMEQRKPLMVFGPKGSGKSRALAAWAAKRVHHNDLHNRDDHREHEFVFRYFAGCSRSSIKVTTFLYECMIALRDFFNLKLDIINTEEKLLWDFPRFVEAAAKEGRVIIVLDGVEHLQLSNGHSASLKWLPFTFPPRVRMMLSTTAPPPTMNRTMSTPMFITQQHGGGGASAEEESAKSYDERAKAEGVPDSSTLLKIESEAARRKWEVLKLAMLPQARRKEIVRRFLIASSAPSRPPSANDVKAVVGTADDARPNRTLRLFHSQIDQICAKQESMMPLFLFTLLRALRIAADLGHDLNAMLTECLAPSVDTCAALLEVIIARFTKGNSPSEASVLAACNAAIAADGAKHLVPRVVTSSSQPCTEEEKTVRARTMLLLEEARESMAMGGSKQQREDEQRPVSRQSANDDDDDDYGDDFDDDGYDDDDDFDVEDNSDHGEEDEGNKEKEGGQKAAAGVRVTRKQGNGCQ